MMIPWLGAASKSLISSLQSSRSRNAKEDTSKQHGEKSISKKMPFQTERILDLDTSIAAAADPLGQGLFQTNISDGFGKLVHPNGTIHQKTLFQLAIYYYYVCMDWQQPRIDWTASRYARFNTLPISDKNTR
eukprot:scaffold30336_cov35-Cyclotella_meneghiniana.AAC.2